MEIKGYVKNVSPEWAYAMKRSVRPGGEISLMEIFNQYGKKHGMEPNDQFVDWLRSVKLPDKNKWIIVFDEGTDKGKLADIPIEPEKSTATNKLTTPIVSKSMTVDDVVGLSVRKARVALPKINDLSLLRYSLKQANQLAGKDSLCKLLHKRIRELQISR